MGAFSGGAPQDGSKNRQDAAAKGHAFRTGFPAFVSRRRPLQFHVELGDYRATAHKALRAARTDMTDQSLSPTKRLRRLRFIRNAYAADLECEKRDILSAFAASALVPAKQLGALHDDLLFLLAFPGEPETRRLAARTLTALVRRLNGQRAADRRQFVDTGVAGSVTRHLYPFPVARWIARRARGDAEIDWRNFADPSLLDHALRGVLCASEGEAFDSGDISTRAWVRLARPRDARSDLEWLLDAMAALPAARADELWAMSEAPIAWRLGASKWSVTRNILKGAPVILRRAMRRPPPEPALRIMEPLREIELLKPARARRVIEVARAALAARCREVVAISYPNPEEVYWCDLGEGVALAVIGVAPSHRLNLETNTGYLLLSNGVPIGYGGVTPLFRQANTGINIFDPFRGGEASYLWVEMLRAFRTLYGVSRFIINPYQFGEGNAEAINSGAYWFYYRLGFRPDNAARLKLAEREAARLKRANAPPSSKAALKALAAGDLTLELPGSDPADLFPERLLAAASLHATRQLAATPATTRDGAERWVAERAAEALGVSSMRRWPAAERRSFARLAPIVGAVPDIGAWPAADRNSIVEMMRAKGRAWERDFALASGRNQMFFRALARRLDEPGRL